MNAHRKSTPKVAMDYPHLEDALFVFWSGNEYNWPHAKRTLSYLSRTKTHVTKGFALFTTDAEDAATFETPAQGEAWLEEQEALGRSPYGYRGKPGCGQRGHCLYLSTVADLKKAKGYSA